MFTSNGHLFPTLDTRWMDSAACQGMSDLFFGGWYEEARAICATCPVRDECLDWATTIGEPAGMWGGLTPDERAGRRPVPVVHVPVRPLLDRFPHLTEDELGERVGAAGRTVARWKAAGRIPYRSAEAAADALGVHPIHLWGVDYLAASLSVTGAHHPSPCPPVAAGGAVR